MTKAERRTIAGLVVAVVLGLALPHPARFLVDHHALDVALAVLVFATAITIPPQAFGGLTAHAGRLILSLVTAALVLPMLSWSVSRLVATLALRRGVLAVGLAPAEIASVATTSLAGGDAPVAAGMLVGSTLITVVAAGFGLRLLGGGAHIHPLSLLTNLGLVVGAPMVLGVAIRSRVALSDRQTATFERASVILVTVLVWLVASQVRLSSAYLMVAVAAAVVPHRFRDARHRPRIPSSGARRHRAPPHHLDARLRGRGRYRGRRVRRGRGGAPRPLRRHRDRLGDRLRNNPTHPARHTRLTVKVRGELLPGGARVHVAHDLRSRDGERLDVVDREPGRGDQRRRLTIEVASTGEALL